jgi:N-acetylmuramoyl-L-alanine amidase
MNKYGLIVGTIRKDLITYEEEAVALLPVEVVEVSPKTRDDAGEDVAGSDKPSTGIPLTPFVELNPVADRIAHRELKVKIGDALKTKTVTWTIEPIPGATPATIRGAWTPSTTHPDRFEASTAYGANGFTRISQASGRTIVSNDGFTAIRVNVPPVAYNKTRVRIAIEGVTTVIDLIDMEVPAIVVIDPGHGGTGPAPPGGSDANHAVSTSGVLEKTMTLDFGLLLRTRLETIRTRDRLNLKIFMTRTGDVNPSLPVRANRARDTGADILLSLHFNGFNKVARGTETYYDSTGNVNQAADQGLAGRINPAVYGAILANDPGSLNRGVKGQGLDVLSDPSLGNITAYSPIRAVLLETEFIDVPAVDQLLNTNATHQQVRQAIINALADAIQDDLLHNPQ